MPGFETEDKNPSLGDPSTQTTTPLSPNQMKGAQQATVNRTQQPSNGQKPSGREAEAQSFEKDQEQKPAGEKQGGDDFLGTQLGALAGAPAQWKSEADAALGLNPAHQQDWWKHTLETPVESYFLGKHLYNAFYNAFLDPQAIQTSVHDIWHQDSAVGWLMRNVFTVERGPLAEKVTGMTPEQATGGAAGTTLSATADPANVLYMSAGVRGAALVSKWMAPTAVNAIFGDKHSVSDLAWGIVPAMVFGTKLPPSVTAQVEKVVPGAAKVFERMSAAMLAQDANKLGVQEREKAIQDLLQQGALPAKSDALAKAWESGIEPLDKKAQNRLEQAILDRYGSSDPDRVVPQLIRDGASPRLLNTVWQKLFKMPYDLLHVAPEEAALVDPRQHRDLMAPEAVKHLDDAVNWSWHMVNQSALGTAGHAASPAVSRFRSLLGLQQTDTLVEKMWTQKMRDMAGAQADDPKVWDQLGRALESSGPEQQAAYEALSPEMKSVRDMMRMVAAGIGKAGEQHGLFQRVHNFWPRVGVLVKSDDGKGFRPLRRGQTTLTSMPDRHRTLEVRSADLLTESRMYVTQAYQTVRQANGAVMRQRDYVVGAILNGTPWHEIASETGAGIPEIDFKEIEQIQAAVRDSPDVARTHAQAYAERLLPQFSENPWDGIAKLGKQLRSITSMNAINDLLGATGKDGKALATVAPSNDRAVDEARRQGYRPINVPGFHSIWVNAQYGKLLEDATKAKDLGAFQKIADLENKSVSMIMFSPRIHGMNMAARLGMAFALHPIEVSRWFAQGLLQEGGLSQLGLKGSERIGPEEYRMIPRRYGLVPPNPHMGASGMFSEQAMNAIAGFHNDAEIGRTPLLRDMSNSSATAKVSSGAKQVLGAVRDLAWGRQNELWSWVSDFGNMMWWIEHAAAQRGGMAGGRLTGEAAARYATARANSWMGHVAPYDWNPNLHAALKTAFFAPNWWRTWGELLTGFYRNQGFGWSSDTIRYVVENEIKTAMSAVLFQQMSANTLNLVFSGHTIYQNDPGNWGKIEISSPWVIGILNDTVLKNNKVDPKTGRDAKGAKLTWENPVGRQMMDTEQAMGLLTSAPSWSPETLAEGFSTFGAARTSPVFQAFAALANVDLYRSIASGSWSHVDPNQDAAFGNPSADVLTALGDLTPFSYISQSIQQQIQQGNVGDVKGPFGLPIPKAVLDAFTPSSLLQDAGHSFLVGLTGTNPGYMRSTRTPGKQPTDDEYKAVHEMQETYQKRMTATSTAALSGQMAPYQWLAVYRQLAAEHSAEMKGIFKHAPEYEHGPLALTNSWEALYDASTDQYGVLDADKLRANQQAWRNDHTTAEYAAVQSELRINDSKYPMLALYHKTQDAYHNWQADWCKENGVDLATLQSDMSGWSAVYNDRNASRQWVRDHPEITQFENAKKNEFESGNSRYGMAGLMYALFFNPTVADRYLGVSGGTDQERAAAAEPIEQQVEGQQVPAAP